jgi:hypothetical protein
LTHLNPASLKYWKKHFPAVTWLLISPRAVSISGALFSRVQKRSVAKQTFGFWVALLHRQYNPVIWSKHLRSVFKEPPTNKSLSDLETAVRRIAQLRNRISHHEPIFRADLGKE